MIPRLAHSFSTSRNPKERDGLTVAVYSNDWYFSSGPSCDCFSSSSTSSPYSSPQSSGPSSTSLSPSIFLPRYHCYHSHGHLCPLLCKYCHLWLSFPLPRTWRNILLPMKLGYRYPHQNCLVHSCCCRHHYGGAVDHLSSCQNIICSPARPRQCSLGSIKNLSRFPSVAPYPTYLALQPWQSILLL